MSIKFSEIEDGLVGRPYWFVEIQYISAFTETNIAKKISDAKNLVKNVCFPPHRTIISVYMDTWALRAQNHNRAKILQMKLICTKFIPSSTTSYLYTTPSLIQVSTLISCRSLSTSEHAMKLGKIVTAV